MKEAALVRQLVSARLEELAALKEKLEQISTGLEMIMKAQLEVQALIEEREEHRYELSETVKDENVTLSRMETLSFGMLLELLVNKLTAVGIAATTLAAGNLGQVFEPVLVPHETRTWKIQVSSDPSCAEVKLAPAPGLVLYGQEVNEQSPQPTWSLATFPATLCLANAS
ncbi:uncharacterized protein PITG_09381 [Phytophthora infestans T30-4]|uniref:Uncharacterized protein n=1 Tax=Phytophthora infestans (strain T30-4) TaxID=403677 RepID=D0NBJ0_PHYIT|nr:uncharacterized protein PITG_09381 [Phytophthora infestans T30-4]EEY55419.1 conserved hypothetical protein [Phytophthora infestans T30-4]|eukprot:XP_002903643.1 conserved hypothetical protein [Phytophthora infestans T30-4]